MVPSGRILVVDDEDPIHTVLTRFLHADGHAVYGASTAEHAIELLRDVEVDLVILDLRLPRGSGLEVLTFIRQDERLGEVPVLILTGSSLTAEEHQLAAANNARIAYKPHSLVALRQFIGTLLSEHRTVA